MATPAAVLSILVKADTSGATASLSKFDTTLRHTGTTTTDLTKRTSTLGNTMRRAAGYAAGAAAAYIGIAQAKAAVSTTEDLAKATISLNQNLGISVKRSSEWAAVARSRGVDTRKLGMAYKTLSTQVEAARDGSTETTKMFRKLGVSQRELAKGSKNVSGLVFDVSDGIKDLGRGTERTAVTSKLFGRAWQDISPLLRDGSSALREQLDLANKYGATFGGKSLDSVKDLIAAQRELAIAQMGLQIAFTEHVAPALMDAGLAIAEFIHQIQTGKGAGGKFAEVMRTVGDVLKIVYLVVRRVVLILKGLVEAVIWVVKKFGFLIDIAKGVAHAFMWIVNAVGDVGGAFRDVFGGLAGFVSGAFNAITKPIKNAIGWMVDKVRWVIDKIKDAKDMLDDIVPDVSAPGVTSVIDKFGEDWQKVGHRVMNMEDQITRSQAKAMKQRIANLRDHGRLTEAGYQDILEQIRDKTGKAEAVSTRNFFQAANRGDKATTDLKNKVGSNITGLANAVAGGMENIRDNTNKSLQAFGVKKLSFSIAKIGSAVGDAVGGHQTGGIVVPGSGSGDKVPLQAMVEPGEGVFVLNRNAMGALQGLNAAVPRFQRGGYVDVWGKGMAHLQKGGNVMGTMVARANQMDAMAQPYVWGGGHGNFGNGPWDCSGAVSEVLHAAGLLSAPMVSGALASWGKPGRGALTVYANPEHTFMSMAGKFFGTSGSNPGGGAGWFPSPDPGYLSGFAARTMSAAGSAMVGAIERVLLKGPEGPMHDLGQRALDKSRKAANAYLSKKAGAFAGGGDSMFLGKGPGKIVGASVYGFGEAGTGTVGASGQSLIGKPAFAELGMGTALGHLPFGKQLKITVGGRTAMGEKLDIGLGGGSVQGHPRAIDFWQDLATQLGVGSTFLGLAKVQGLAGGGVVGPSAGGSGGGHRVGLFRSATQRLEFLRDRLKFLQDKHPGRKNRIAFQSQNIERLETLLGLLGERRSARTHNRAISAAQAGIFGMPIMHGGGIVPGPIGRDMPVMAQGGELMGGRGGIKVIVHGDIVSDRRDPVEVVLGDRRFPAAVERVRSRGGNRSLPGRGGGL